MIQGDGHHVQALNFCDTIPPPSPKLNLVVANLILVVVNFENRMFLIEGSGSPAAVSEAPMLPSAAPPLLARSSSALLFSPPLFSSFLLSSLLSSPLSMLPIVDATHLHPALHSDGRSNRRGHQQNDGVLAMAIGRRQRWQRNALPL